MNEDILTYEDQERAEQLLSQMQDAITELKMLPQVGTLHSSLAKLEHSYRQVEKSYNDLQN